MDSFSLIAWIIFISHPVSGEIIQKPVDTEAVVNSEVALYCQTDNIGGSHPVQWHYIGSTPTDFRTIYTLGRIRNGFRGRFTVNPDPTNGQYNLVIKNVTKSDAASYVCQEGQSSHKIELVVFDRYPSEEFCSLSPAQNGLEDKKEFSSDTKLSCMMRYQGKLQPYLEWSFKGQVIPSNEESVDGILTSTVRLQNDSGLYNCRTKYRDSNIVSKLEWSSARYDDSSPQNGDRSETPNCTHGSTGNTDSGVKNCTNSTNSGHQHPPANDSEQGDESHSRLKTSLVTFFITSIVWIVALLIIFAIRRKLRYLKYLKRGGKGSSITREQEEHLRDMEEPLQNVHVVSSGNFS